MRERLRTGVTTSGLLVVGDWKMRALDTRASMAGPHDVSLSPLPLTGATAEAMDAWIAEGVTHGEAGEVERMVRPKDRGHEVLAAEGDELERTCGAQAGEEAWRARVVVVRSPVHAARQVAGVETRLVKAEKNRAALTPPRGRGKRQITEQTTLVEAGIRLRRDNLVSVMYAEALNSGKSSVTFQRTDRHGIVDQKLADFQASLW